jgi:hypothetical protein
MEVSTFLREFNILVHPPKQVHTALIFQRLDLTTNRALGQTQLLRGYRETTVSGGNLEGVEQVQRRQSEFFHFTLLRCLARGISGCTLAQ